MRYFTAQMSPLARWPFALAHLLLAMAYLSTGLTKVVFGGLKWMSGDTGGRGFFGHLTVVLILLICYDTPWLRPQPRLAPA